MNKLKIIIESEPSNGADQLAKRIAAMILASDPECVIVINDGPHHKVPPPRGPIPYPYHKLDKVVINLVQLKKPPQFNNGGREEFFQNDDDE